MRSQRSTSSLLRYIPIFFVLLYFSSFLWGCPVKKYAQRFEPKLPAIPLHPKKQGVPKWIFEAKERIVSTPAVGLNTIYVGSLDRKLSAVNSKTGKLKWVFKDMDDLVLSSPATTADGSTIYIASRGNSLYAVNEDGRKKWEFATQGEIDSSPKVGIDGTIYVASHDAKLYALPPEPEGDQKNPRPKWVYEFNEKFRRSSPAMNAAGDLIYIGSAKGSLHAIPLTQNKKKATAKWVRKVCDKITSSPKIDTNGTIYVSCWGRHPVTSAEDRLKGELKAIKPNGDVKWSYPTERPILSSPQIGRDGTIFFGSDDTYFHAVDRNGNEVWKFQSGVYQKIKGKVVRRDGSEAYIQATAAINPQNGTIYFGSINEFVYALTPQGKLIWHFDARGWVDNAPVIHGKGDILYVAAGNRLFAMNP